MSVFPMDIWDGTSQSRPDPEVDRDPDYKDWNQFTSELKATQTFVLGDGPRVTLPAADVEDPYFTWERGAVVKVVDGEFVPASNLEFDPAFGMVDSVDLPNLTVIREGILDLNEDVPDNTEFYLGDADGLPTDIRPVQESTDVQVVSVGYSLTGGKFMVDIQHIETIPGGGT